MYATCISEGLAHLHSPFAGPLGFRKQENFKLASLTQATPSASQQFKQDRTSRDAANLGHL